MFTDEFFVEFLSFIDNNRELKYKEVELLKPKYIFATGNNVYKFLLTKHIEPKPVKLIYPAYYLFRGQKQKGVEYYKEISNTIEL